MAWSTTILMVHVNAFAKIHTLVYQVIICFSILSKNLYNIWLKHNLYLVPYPKIKNWFEYGGTRYKLEKYVRITILLSDFHFNSLTGFIAKCCGCCDAGGSRLLESGQIATIKPVVEINELWSYSNQFWFLNCTIHCKNHDCLGKIVWFITEVR